MVGKESCLRKQNRVQVRRKQMTELMPACPDVPSSVGGTLLHWDGEMGESANGIGSLRTMGKSWKNHQRQCAKGIYGKFRV